MQVSSEARADASTTDWLGLDGARVLVVGSGGIGATAVRGYLDAGARVVLVDLDQSRLDTVAAEIAAESQTESAGARLSTIQADLRARGAGAAVVGEAIERLGGLDVVLHCVGVNDRRPILDFTDDEWDRVLDINLTTAFAVAQAAGRHMVAQRSGRIVLLSSVSGLLAHKNHAPYAASKGGMNQMARVMAAEWASSGVTVNTLAPGYIETPLTEAYLAKPGIREDLERLVPAGRLGIPSDVVDAALFLSSPRAAFITGHVLYIDGGRTLV